LDVSKIGQKTENHGECNSWFLMISGWLKTQEWRKVRTCGMFSFIKKWFFFSPLELGLIIDSCVYFLLF
jgi:hypothetical protein